MRRFRALCCWLLLAGSVHAANLTVRILDPDSVAVAGAQVSLLGENGTVIAFQSTAADGVASFPFDSKRSYELQVLAPGFAPLRSRVDAGSDAVTLNVRVAGATENVVVTATRFPTPEAESSTSVDSLSGAQLQTMNPVAAADALRFLPGAIVAVAGQRGGLGSVFVRGGDSRYNRVVVDAVPVNEPGGRFDFGVLPLAAADRLEFVRGAESTLYGSDAMTSVLQVFTATGSTRTPEFTFGADGGNFASAHGYVGIAGARGRLDFNLFGDQWNTSGQGLNAAYSDSLQGGNVGIRLSRQAALRLRARHTNSRTGVPSEWRFNGQPLMSPDMEQRARQNNFLASADLTIAGPSRWQHRLVGFEYNHRSLNQDDVMEPGRVSPSFGNIDFPFQAIARINRAGFSYQADYMERSWARTTAGYEFEDENGVVGDLTFPPLTHGLRLNHAVYAEQSLTRDRVSLVAGLRWVHNQTFGNKTVPRIAATYRLRSGGRRFSATRLRFSYATGIKEPLLEESFASGPFILPSPTLKAEENRAFEAGFEQGLAAGKYSLTALYYHNLFRNQITFATDPVTFVGQYLNLNRSIAHGAEIALHGRPLPRLSLDGAYNYTSTQILDAPFAFDPLLAAGQPLVRRPKHSGSVLMTYLGSRWGANLGGSFVGRRPDSDFLGFGVTHAAGYARVDLGGWYAITSRLTAYCNVENALNRSYEEVVGYPALGVNARAGLRLKLGGE